MPSRLRAVPGLALAAILFGCTDTGPSYTRIEVEKGRALLARGSIAIVDAESAAASEPFSPHEVIHGVIRWGVSDRGPMQAPPELSAAVAVLVVGGREAIAHRAAASLARRGNHPVYVFIPRDANERVSLYAVARQTKEASRGEDS
jgi:hypothetical protein